MVGPSQDVEIESLGSWQFGIVEERRMKMDRRNSVDMPQTRKHRCKCAGAPLSTGAVAPLIPLLVVAVIARMSNGPAVAESRTVR